MRKIMNLLTDIIGLEDFSGDMDFKVAGTDSGSYRNSIGCKNSGTYSRTNKKDFRTELKKEDLRFWQKCSSNSSKIKRKSFQICTKN